VTGRLVHTGQVVVDLVMEVPALPPPGGDVLASATSLHAGGGINVMAAAARAGADVVYAGGHGTGRFGDLARAALAAEGITVVLPPEPDGDSGVCVVLVDGSGERTFVTGSGAESGGLAPVALTGVDIVYVSGYSLLVPQKRAALLDLDLAGATLLVDPGPLAGETDPAVWARLLARTAVLSCSTPEARLLSGRADPQDAAAELTARLRPDGAVVVREGENGCLLARGGSVERVRGFPVTAVDTNGAGDAHCGVLAAELLRGAPLPEAALRANAAAALAVTRRGPATAPGRAEVDALLEGAPPETAP
jgi:sugar/nucleoside kinase (ribokinase family)